MAIGRRLRILLSEGSSLSARQAITVLGLAGHWIEICDSDPLCIGRFSRFVRRWHRCPGLGVDPEGYLAFVLDRTGNGGFDVLFRGTRGPRRVAICVDWLILGHRKYRQINGLRTGTLIPAPESFDINDLAGGGAGISGRTA